MLITSDVFVDKALANIDGAVDYKTTTTKGAFLQAILLVSVIIGGELL